jgi:hypothetical protein
MALHARSYLYFGWINIADGPPDTAGYRDVSHVISLAPDRKVEQPPSLVAFAQSSVYASMALPTYGRVLLDTTAGDIDIELWSKVRHANMTRSYLCKYIMFTGSTEGMPELHSVGHGRYAWIASLVRMSVKLCGSNYYARTCKKAIMTGSSFTGEPSLSHTHRLFTRPMLGHHTHTPH